MDKIKGNRQLAEIVKVSPTTIIFWRDKLDMPFEQVGLNYEYDLTQVLTWLANRSDKHRRHVETILEDMNNAMEE